MTRRSIPAAITIAVLALAGGGSAAIAKNGADDPAGHNAGDDHGSHSSTHPRHHSRDDSPTSGRHGRHHRRGGHDDGPNPQ
jgi:hypothetical protein